MASPHQDTHAPRRQSSPLTWLIIFSLLLHILLIVVLQPWAKTGMAFNTEENADRAQLVAQREEIRKAQDDARRQKTPIPEEYREALKKEAERRKQDSIQKRVKRMLADRREAERQREEAFERLRQRDREEHIRKHVTPKIEAAAENTREKIEEFKSSKPESKKTDKDRKLEAQADELADRVDEAVKKLQDQPETSQEQLDEIKKIGDALHRLGREGKDRGAKTHEPAWELANEGNDLRKAARQAQAEQDEADKLHDTSEAQDVAPEPAAALLASGETPPPTSDSQGQDEGSQDESGEGSGADAANQSASGSDAAKAGDDAKGGDEQDKEGGSGQQGGDKPKSGSSSGQASEKGESKNKDASGKSDKPKSSKPGSSSSGSSGPSSGQPSAAELYQAARELEEQTQALVDDTRAAEMAMRSETSFGTARKKLTSHAPDREDLTPALTDNGAGTIGELNAYRSALQQATNQVQSMSDRTAAMTRGVQAIQSRRASSAAAGGSSAGSAGQDGYADMTEGGLSVGGGSGMGNSSGYRAGSADAGGQSNTPSKAKGEMRLPKSMITANALPGRMLTDASARKGWLYLDTWYVIGPWNVNYKNTFSDIHPPELGIDFDATYTDGKFKNSPKHPYHQMRWEFIQSDKMMLQPPQVFGSETWYAYTEVYSDKTRDMLLAVASDDFAKVWLNEKVVWDDPSQSAYDMGEALRKVTFHQGFNRILIRVGNGPGPMVWSVLISPPEVLDYLDQ